MVSYHNPTNKRITGTKVGVARPPKPAKPNMTSRAMTGQPLRQVSPEEMEFILREARKLR